MIDALLTIIDKLLQLANYRGARNSRAFAQLVDPIFSDLQTVHHDYVRAFVTARQDLERSPDTLSSIIERLERERVEYEAVRTKLMSLGAIVSPASSKAEKAFLRAVECYFPIGEIRQIKPFRTALTTLLAELRAYMLVGGDWVNADGHSISSDVTDPLSLIDYFLKLQRLQWESVCDAYAAAKEAFLSGD